MLRREFLARRAARIARMKQEPKPAPEPGPDITDEQYRQAARARFGHEGTIEIDEAATVSRGDDPGAYVQAWVWVYDSDLKEAA